MDRKASTSTSSIIFVETEIVVHTEDNVENILTSSHAPSVKSIIRSMSTRQRKATEASDDDSRPHSQPENDHHHPRAMTDSSDDMADMADMRNQDDGFKELIQLLNQPPPPGNHMSIPDQISSSSEDDKWKKFKIKVLRKRPKSHKHRPPTIKLPDSAVAARTTGGHRHIAISIPLEHSHMAPLENSQYPVYESMTADFQREIESRLGALRNSIPGRPTGVLKPVAEDQESTSSISLSPRAPPYVDRTTVLSAPLQRRHTVSLIPPQQQRYAPRKGMASSLHGKASPRLEHPLIPPSRHGRLRATTSYGEIELEARRRRDFGIHDPEQGCGDDLVTQTLEILPIPQSQRRSIMQQKEKNQADNEPPKHNKIASRDYARAIRDTEATRTVPTGTHSPVQLNLPFRTSSKNAKTGVPQHGDTIDNIIESQRSSFSGNDSTNGSGNGHGAHLSAIPRGSFAESLVTTASSPQLMKAQTATAYRMIPIVVRPPSRPEESPLNLDFPRPPVTTVDRSVQTVTPPPVSGPKRSMSAAAAPTVSRTLSRKEKVRERKQRDMERLIASREHGKFPAHMPPSLTTGGLWPESPVLGRFSDVGSPTRPASMPASMPGTLRIKKPNLTPISVMPGMPPNMPSLSPTAILGRHRKEETEFKYPSGTSFSSPSLSDSHGLWDNDSDRISYHRRKERKAEKAQKQERKARYIAKALAEEQEETGRLSRQELLKRYASLREARIYEMEKRMRRLERNGEVWLRSLGPMMETLNRLLESQQVYQQQSHYMQHIGEQPRRHTSADVSSGSFASAQTSDSRRSQSVGGERKHRRQRPQSLFVGESSMRGGQLAPAHHSPLQEEFEKALTARRVNEAREEEIDARMRQTALEAQYVEAAPHSVSTEGDAGYVSSRNSKGRGLEAIEPLMRELQDAARFDVETQAEVGARGSGETHRLDEDDLFAGFSS
ncbi:hypothetical protein F5Y15DRAFT_383926 [Xylariaceae sp. FL0016]|nr:hypothetical protein F5Y15DRAFT_383926 [Xylariaceae sp. FL0016]